MASEKTPTLVFIPFPVMSHQAAAIQMANLLVARDHRLSATIIVMKMPVDTKFTSHPTNTNDDNPRINIVELPQDDSNLMELGRTPQTFVTHFIPSQKGPVRDVLDKITTVGSARLVGFVVDMFCTSMMDVADELGVPSYVFFTCGAATLGLYFHLQGLKDHQNRDLAMEHGNNSAVSVPTYANPVPTKVWPSFVFDNASSFPDFARKFRGAKGIVVNTFLELETHAIRALSGDGMIPPVYPVGPIIHDQAPGVETGDGIIKWLDTQPDSSVVFICFGSIGSLERDQVEEIAVALESCGQGFLWSLRKLPPKEMLGFPGEYENLGDILPDGFLERTIGFGKVIGWAPQFAILSHPAVGGFVSHCGWNSTLESVWCDVPVAAWPLAAEQQANAFQLVKELGMAVEIKMDYRTGSDEIVPAGVIEKAIRELMGPGNIEGRAKLRALSEKSRVVMTEGGSSYDYLGRFIKNVLDNVS